MAAVTWCRVIFLWHPDSMCKAIPEGLLNIPWQKGHLKSRPRWAREFWCYSTWIRNGKSAVNMAYVQKGHFRTEVARTLKTPVMVRWVEKVLIESIHVSKLAPAPIAVRVIVNGIWVVVIIIDGSVVVVAVVTSIHERSRCIIIRMFWWVHMLSSKRSVICRIESQWLDEPNSMPPMTGMKHHNPHRQKGWRYALSRSNGTWEPKMWWRSWNKLSKNVGWASVRFRWEFSRGGKKGLATRLQSGHPVYMPYGTIQFTLRAESYEIEGT